MTMLPEFQLCLLGGWLPMVFLYLVFGLLLLLFPKAVVKRLYDRTGRPKRPGLRVPLVLVTLAYFALIVLSPLRTGTWMFYLGAVIYGLGFMGFVSALVSFRRTPADKPVTTGLYKVSRHPQQVMITLAFLGIVLATGSWLMLIFFILILPFVHLKVKAEETACLTLYGDSYKQYMAQRPRYFVLF